MTARTISLAALLLLGAASQARATWKGEVDRTTQLRDRAQRLRGTLVHRMPTATSFQVGADAQLLFGVGFGVGAVREIAGEQARTSLLFTGKGRLGAGMNLSAGTELGVHRGSW